jgi:N-carbamoyl-L-amino-acid hydrolase
MTSAAAVLADLERRYPERLAWTAAWAESCRWLADQMHGIGADLEVDRAGNQWFTLRGTRDAFVVLGGHLDNTPGAERAHESLGLVAGVIALRRFAAAGVPPVTVKLVNWVDGAGTRFGRPFGASAAAGTMTDWFAAAELVDRFGSSLNEVAESAGLSMRLVHMARRALRGMSAYLELGIEPASGSPIAIAESATGVVRCRIRWLDPAEAGASAVRGAGERFAAEVDGVAPLEPTGAVQLLDARDSSAAALDTRLDAALEASDRIATSAAVAVEWRRIWSAAPVTFDHGLTALAAETLSAPRVPALTQAGAAELARGGLAATLVVLRDASRIDLAEEAVGSVLQALLEQTAR